MESATGYAQDASGAERLVFGDVTILVRASAETTGGAYTLFEEVPPLVDTPLHVHENEDELFFVLEGEHVFQVGDEEFPAGVRCACLRTSRRSSRAAARRARRGAAACPHLAGWTRGLLPGACRGTGGGNARA